jgi:hypothetical protein
LPKARHCWPSLEAPWHSWRCARAQRAHRAVATHAAARWQGFTGGLGVARPTGTPRESDAGCVRQGGRGRVLTGVGRWQWGRENGSTRWCSKVVVKLQWPRWASMSPAAGGGDRGCDVRSKRDGRWRRGRAHREGGQWCSGAKVVRRRRSYRPAWTRGRGKKGGDGVLRHALTRQDGGERKGVVRWWWGAPNRRHSGGWGTGHGRHHAVVRCGGVGPARRSGGAVWPTAAQLRHSWVVHVRVACYQRRNRGGRRLTGGPCYSPRRRWFEHISNSNESKLLQNLSNFD